MDEGLHDTEVVNYAIDFNSLRKAVMSCAHTIWQGMMPRPCNYASFSSQLQIGLSPSELLAEC